jgi:hypothetical protein
MCGRVKPVNETQNVMFYLNIKYLLYEKIAIV